MAKRHTYQCRDNGPLCLTQMEDILKIMLTIDEEIDEETSDERDNSQAFDDEYEDSKQEGMGKMLQKHEFIEHDEGNAMRDNVGQHRGDGSTVDNDKSEQHACLEQGQVTTVNAHQGMSKVVEQSATAALVSSAVKRNNSNSKADDYIGTVSHSESQDGEWKMITAFFNMKEMLAFAKLVNTRQQVNIDVIIFFRRLLMYI